MLGRRTTRYVEAVPAPLGARSDVFAEDIVLDHRGESCLAILGRHQCGKGGSGDRAVLLQPGPHPTDASNDLLPTCRTDLPHVNTTVESVSK